MGTYISWNLRDDYDVKERIKAANKIFGAARHNFYGNKAIPLELRVRFYKAIVVNILLWGCESWALRSRNYKEIRVVYRRHIRAMLRVTVFYKIRNERLLELAQMEDIIAVMHLRQLKWIEKIAYMEKEKRIPRKLFAGWICGKNAVRNFGGQTKTIAHTHNRALKEVGIKGNQSKFVKKLFEIIKKPKEWAKRVETKLGLKEGTYRKKRKKNENEIRGTLPDVDIR